MAWRPLRRDGNVSGDRFEPDRIVRVGDLAAGAAVLAGVVPAGVGALVAVARSGLVPAGVIAGYRHLPVWSTCGDGLQRVGFGSRFDGALGAIRSVAVVDDTVFSGAAMGRAVVAARAHFGRVEVYRLCVFCHPQGREAVDWFYAELPGPHYLGWNFPNSGVGEWAGYDLDGVICEDCPLAADDDGREYSRFLVEARPGWLPVRRSVRLIVTARLSRYEKATCAWLDRYGVRFDRLVMWPGNDPEARRYRIGVGEWKASVLGASSVRRFVESDSLIAAAIARAWPFEVVCPGLGRVLNYRGECGDARQTVTASNGGLAGCVL